MWNCGGNRQGKLKKEQRPMNNEERKKGPMWENKYKGEMENDARRHVAWEMRGKKEKEINGKKVVRSRGHL